MKKRKLNELEPVEQKRIYKSLLDRSTAEKDFYLLLPSLCTPGMDIPIINLHFSIDDKPTEFYAISYRYNLLQNAASFWAKEKAKPNQTEVQQKYANEIYTHLQTLLKDCGNNTK